MRVEEGRDSWRLWLRAVEDVGDHKMSEQVLGCVWEGGCVPSRERCTVEAGLQQAPLHRCRRGTMQAEGHNPGKVLTHFAPIVLVACHAQHG